MKKMIALLAVMMMFTSVAFAADFEGKVTKIKGDKVTVEITKGKVAKIKKGAKVTLDVDAAAAPKKGGGMDMLQGC